MSLIFDHGYVWKDVNLKSADSRSHAIRLFQVQLTRCFVEVNIESVLLIWRFSRVVSIWCYAMFIRDHFPKLNSEKLKKKACRNKLMVCWSFSQELEMPFALTFFFMCFKLYKLRTLFHSLQCYTFLSPISNETTSLLIICNYRALNYSFILHSYSWKIDFT